MRWLAVVLAAAIVCGLGCRPVAAPPKLPLQSVASIRALSEPELQKGLPVGFHASVTYWEPRTRVLIVNDGTGGILVDRLNFRQEVGSGSKIYVEGYTGYDSFAPIILKANVEVEKGRWSLPAKPVSPADILAGRYEHQ